MSSPESTLPTNTDPASTGLGRSARRAVFSGASWSLLPQVWSLVINLALTPYVIHGLGIARYGLYMFALTLGNLGSSFDGGITRSAQRFFAVYAGRNDKDETTRLLATLLVVVSGVSVVIFSILWFLGPVFVDHLHMDPSLRGEGTYLVRMLGVLLGVALIRNIPTAILYGHQRYVLPNVTATVVYAEYVIGLVLTVQQHWGLRGVAWTFAIQQAIVTLVIMPATFRHLSRHGWRLYSWKETQAFLSYASKVQVVNLSNLFIQEVDIIVVGAVLPIRYVAIYNAGASFALQLRNVLNNAAAPIMTTLGQTLGRDGRSAMNDQFVRLQRHWVQIVSGWCVVGAAAVAFAITAWLGSDFEQGGIIGAVVLAGNLFFLGPSVLNSALGLLDRPGIEARFSVVMVLADVLLTVPLVFVGPIGVAAATAAAQATASVYLVRKVRRSVSPSFAGFLQDVPVVRCLVAAGVVVLLELTLLPVRPTGPFGLLLCGVPAALGLVVYALLMVGPADALRLVRTFAARMVDRRSRPDPAC